MGMEIDIGAFVIFISLVQNFPLLPPPSCEKFHFIALSFFLVSFDFLSPWGGYEMELSGKGPVQKEPCYLRNFVG